MTNLGIIYDKLKTYSEKDKFELFADCVRDKLDARCQSIFSLILVDIKSRLSKDIIETLKTDDLLPDDINFILYNEEVKDE